MALAVVESAAVHGVDAVPIRIEADLSFGLPSFHIVGLADSAVREARERVRTALKNSGFDPYPHRITVNLAPADLRKEGTGFDLPIALALLGAQGLVPAAAQTVVCVGELGLDGQLRPIPGALPIALLARAEGARALLLPAANAREAAVVANCPVIGAATLREAVDWLAGRIEIAPTAPEPGRADDAADGDAPDFAEVAGQAHAKRALEVAAAGGHNALLIGPPGAGKTMLAMRLPSILPQPTFEEALETTKIYSVAGLLPDDAPLLRRRPFRSPHHSISDGGLVGGGPRPGPGELSLAHNGVLFLDELPEFKKHVLELLRQPLEDGQLTLSRATIRVTYPARAMLVASMDPCPCGYHGDTNRPCTCDPRAVANYRGRLSGPLLDRIDLHVDVPAIQYRELRGREPAESSAVIRQRVAAARARQFARFDGRRDVHGNVQMRPRDLRRWCSLDRSGHELLERAVERLGMSARATTRILKVARTIADLEPAATIAPSHLAEAIQYRTLDRAASPVA